MNHRSYCNNIFIIQIISEYDVLFIFVFPVDPHFKDTPYFDEKVVANYSYPFGTMARVVEDYSLENMNDPQEPDPE